LRMKPKLKFMLDYGANPLWSNDEFTRQKFGHNIDNLQDLALSDKTIELSKFVTELYWDVLNPIYPMLPSFWSGEMHLFFRGKLNQLFDRILNEIGSIYDIENREEIELNSHIDIQKINFEVKEFLGNPNMYYRTNGISHNKTDEEEKKYVAIEYEKWRQKELALLGK
jgi:hypothetical protein